MTRKPKHVSKVDLFVPRPGEEIWVEFGYVDGIPTWRVHSGKELLGQVKMSAYPDFRFGDWVGLCLSGKAYLVEP
jgi:hypothetical protein